MRSRRLLDHALGYANAGRAVFPVRRDKRPYTAHGFKDASTDPATIRSWWQQHPEAGIATPTGNGWFVLDVDNPEALSALEAEHGPLPPTRRVVTPRPGLHIYLRGRDVTNRSGALPDGIDIRGRGGYVLLPPSPHPNGSYEWRDDDLDVAPAPGWLLDLLRPQSTNGHAPPVEGAIPHLQRNTTLASMAGTMRRRGFSADAITAALLVENRDRCKPPLTDADVRKIAVSISRYQPADEVIASLGDLSSLLGLEEVGKRIDQVQVFGRGSKALVRLHLDDGEHVVLDPLGACATPTKLTLEMASQAGATPALKAPDVASAIRLVYLLAQHTETVEVGDRAWELGADYLRAAAIGEVVMADQASRWEAFCVLERSTARNVMLADSQTGIRYVRIGRFEEYVRQHAGGVAEAVLRAMPSLGWHKRGATGQIKATRPGFSETLRYRFFEVPKGWEH